MNIKFREKYIQSLQLEQEALTARAEALKAADRLDEANLLKASRNIYGICAELLKTTNDRGVYLDKLMQLKEAWQQARLRADEHSDYARIALEDTKLAALDDVFARFETLSQEEGS